MTIGQTRTTTKKEQSAEIEQAVMAVHRALEGTPGRVALSEGSD